MEPEPTQLAARPVLIGAGRRPRRHRDLRGDRPLARLGRRRSKESEVGAGIATTTTATRAPPRRPPRTVDRGTSTRPAAARRTTATTPRRSTARSPRRARRRRLPTPRATADPARSAVHAVPTARAGVSATLATCAWQPTNGGQYEGRGRRDERPVDEPLVDDHDPLAAEQPGDRHSSPRSIPLAAGSVRAVEPHAGRTEPAGRPVLLRADCDRVLARPAERSTPGASPRSGRGPRPGSPPATSRGPGAPRSHRRTLAARHRAAGRRRSDRARGPTSSPRMPSSSSRLELCPGAML